MIGVEKKDDLCREEGGDLKPARQELLRSWKMVANVL
jgi:hypothetical protein